MTVIWGCGGAALSFTNVAFWSLMQLGRLHLPLESPLVAFSASSPTAPYSIRNLTDSSLIQYELDSK